MIDQSNGIIFMCHSVYTFVIYIYILHIWLCWYMYLYRYISLCACLGSRAVRERSRAPVQAFASCTPLSIRANRRCVWRATFHMHRVPHDAQKSDTSVRARARFSLSRSLGYRPDIDLSRFRGSIRGAK